ncbi:MAG: TlpA disulfide reductase family protein [Bacillota bacterium]|nr:TlpA disulfide reductase family protein [Bacillota bacterium]
MKKALLLIVTTILLVSGAMYVQSAYNKSSAKNPAVASSNGGQSSAESHIKLKVKAPDFKLTDLNGKEVSLSEFKGKNVFLNFWATWCPPCREEMPDIEKLYQETKGTDLVILGVELGESRQDVNSFTSKNGYNYEFLLDTDNKAAVEYNISSIPSSFFIDKDGNISATHLGYMDLSQMKSYVELLEKQ